MPKMDPKQVQKELDSGLLWPVYWLYGSERMKSREVLSRIRKVALGETIQVFCAETLLEGAEVDVPTILDAALSPSLGGGVRLIVVRDAHLVKESEDLVPLLGVKAKAEQLMSVVVFLSKDLDGRKKFSKTLVEKAAVVSCEEVGEAEREAWIQYLAKKKGLQLAPESSAQLSTLDPWSLDIVDQELEKLALSQLGGGGTEVLLVDDLSFGARGGADAFLDAFFHKNLKQAMERVASFADQPDEALPLLGLFSWNVRQLALIVYDQQQGSRSARMNPYLAERFKRWAPRWTLDEVCELQHRLAEVDFGFKQTPLLPLGLWSGLVQEFCKVSPVLNRTH
ncbi:DNA polymerase III subunit delta [Bdellovibrionota bacterium FG-1]